MVPRLLLFQVEGGDGIGHSIDNSDKEDGEHDCTATNTTKGNGPYTLTCEKEGDEITIHFPNGGFIVVHENGYHPETGDNWDVELD